MILPLSTLPFAAVGAGITAVTNLVTGQSFDPMSIFIDMQAEVVELNMDRYLVEHPIPSREGGVLQDLGSKCSVLSLRGKWIYENRPDKDIIDIIPALKILENIGVGWNWLRLQTMQIVYRTKEPLFIGCDLINTAVMIDKMKFKHVGGTPNVYEYQMTLREFNPLLGLVGLAYLPMSQEDVGY